LSEVGTTEDAISKQGKRNATGLSGPNLVACFHEFPKTIDERRGLSPLASPGVETANVQPIRPDRKFNKSFAAAGEIHYPGTVPHRGCGVKEYCTEVLSQRLHFEFEEPLNALYKDKYPFNASLDEFICQLDGTAGIA